MGVLLFVATPTAVAITANAATSTPAIVTPTVEPEMTLDERVSFLAKKYGVNEYSAREIIRCESRWKPDAVGNNWRYKKLLDANGNIVLNAAGKPTYVKDYIWSRDIGYWQINTYYHKADMAKLGWDIYDPADNLEAGFYLFSKQGAKPWAWSKPCHGIS